MAKGKGNSKTPRHRVVGKAKKAGSKLTRMAAAGALTTKGRIAAR